MHPFEAYLQEHNIKPLVLSRQAQVRYLTIWNAMKGRPITHDHAYKIHYTLLLLTGRLYAGPLALFEADVLADTPTIPMKKMFAAPSYRKAPCA